MKNSWFPLALSQSTVANAGSYELGTRNLMLSFIVQCGVGCTQPLNDHHLSHVDLFFGFNVEMREGDLGSLFLNVETYLAGGKSVTG